MEATATVPRVVDCHGLLHVRASKSVKACCAADAVDGLTVLQNPTIRLVAAAFGVSIGSVARARRLTPEQRQAVKQGRRPLVLPRMPSVPPLPLAARPIVGPQERLAAIVDEIGFDRTVNLLHSFEMTNAA
jgi:hypothetical protein